MILSSLRKAWEALGDERLQLMLYGAMVPVCLLDVADRHWWHLGLSLVVLALFLPPTWRALAPKAGRDAKRLAKTSKLAGHSPIGAHVDEPRRWRK